jgi:uncharacterized damage-inducible protein DinB
VTARPGAGYDGGMELRFLALADRQLEQNIQKIRAVVELMDEGEVWWRPNESCNSVGNLLLHLCGNLSQWILAGVGGELYERRRSAEFAARETERKAEILARLTDVVSRCRSVVATATREQLLGIRQIQGTETDGLGATFHAVEHMGYHTGQIIYIAKQLIGTRKEIEFYPQLRGK